LAWQPQSAGRDQFRADAESAWRAAFRKVKTAKPTYPQKIACIDLGIADLIDWLAEDLRATRQATAEPASKGPTIPAPRGLRAERLDVVADEHGADTTDSSSASLTKHAVVDEMAKLSADVIDKVLADIATEHGGTIPDDVKLALADHFWCDLLANLAHVLAATTKLLDGAPDKIADLVLKSRKKGKWRPIQEKLIRIACHSLWSQVQRLTFFGLFDPVPKILFLVRILGVLICKAPERHKAVVEYCLDPLKDQLRSETKKRLVSVLEIWLPRMKIFVETPGVSRGMSQLRSVTT
jgi:hypothetical protein